ncbi:MAG: apolipoprotein N-acyltransferase [Candidatus Eisenbacteria bacterium]|nr:apolipoprotein N-acyltransferase [Candidatus Eisenbacteria bacterium]
MTASRRDLVLSAASGLVLGAAFLPAPLGWLAWFAFVPLLSALERRLGAGEGPRSWYALGYVGGFAFFLSGTHWIALLSDVAMAVPPLKYAGWVLAGAYLANFWALAVLLAGWLARRSGIPARWTFVVAMMAVEEFRGAGDLGFPWFQPGYTQSVLPPLGLAALGGVTLVTLWVLLLNAAARGWWARRNAVSAVIAIAVLAAGAGGGAWVRSRPLPATTGPAIGLIQGNIAGEIKWSGRHQGEIIARFLQLSDSALAGRPPADRPVMVIWPETATGSYLRKQLEQSITLARWASGRGVAILSGYADYSYDAEGKPLPWNAAGMWLADGHLSPTYAKRHLVPFGERMPFQSLFPALGKLEFGQAEWMPGGGPVVFRGAIGAFSTLICFESIFPGLARADVLAGSRCLVVVTNDEWFGRSAAVHQHAAMAPFRAVENGVPLLRCANTGLTQVIDAHGRVVASAPAFEPAVLTARVPPALPGRTPWTRWGDWPGALSLAVLVALLFVRRTTRAA